LLFQVDYGHAQALLLEIDVAHFTSARME
jgi:hypothetical protein